MGENDALDMAGHKVVFKYVHMYIHMCYNGGNSAATFSFLFFEGFVKTRRVGEARVAGSATGTIVALLPCWCKLKAQLTPRCLRRQFYADSNLQVLTPKGTDENSNS